MNDARDDVGAYLAWDHERLSELLVAAHSGQHFDGASFQAFRAGLLRHIAIEEKLFFSSARRARHGVPIESAHALRVEHAALTSLLVPTPDATLCDEIRSLLEAHNDKEEGPFGVYAECAMVLSPAESEDLAARVFTFPEVRVTPHFDGPGVYRTARLALAAAQRMKRGVPP